MSCFCDSILLSPAAQDQFLLTRFEQIRVTAFLVSPGVMMQNWMETTVIDLYYLLLYCRQRNTSTLSLHKAEKQVCHLHGNYSTNKTEKAWGGHSYWIYESSFFVWKSEYQSRIKLERWFSGETRVCIQFKHDV